ncbi:hypothetical protein V493_02164 [Pseudogymnoascus sp. VKM F-4281 (FW-2241)]|nr:hypothetical protein V493_02164 [Pseudogymnoascus sp. VKM F-4281 (FW-2241)]
MHFFSVVSVCLLCSSLAAAGPLPRDRFHKLQFRQAAPFRNTTNPTDIVRPPIQVVPVTLKETPLSTATTTTITSSSSEPSTASTATTLLAAGFNNTDLPSASTVSATAGDGPIISSTSPTALAAEDGANSAQSAIASSQTATQPISSDLSGFAPSGSIVGGTGNFSRTTLVSANSNTDASADSKPSTRSQVFPFTESFTTTLDAASTTAEPQFAFSSPSATPTTSQPLLFTVSGVGVAVLVTPSFSTSSPPIPITTEAPTTTSEEPIIQVPTRITAASSPEVPAASMPAQFEKNLQLSHYYNDLFLTLNRDMRCVPTGIACIEGSMAICVDGRYSLDDCYDVNQGCFALPLKASAGVVVRCENFQVAEQILGKKNQLGMTLVVTTTRGVIGSTSVTDPGPTTTAVAVATAAAVQSSDSDEGEEESEEVTTTVVHSTIVSTITINASDFAPSTVVKAAEAATPVTTAAATSAAAADKGLAFVVPVAGAAAGGSADGEAEGKEEGKEDGGEGGGEDGPVTVTVTRSVTVTEQFTVMRAAVTATVTTAG